jgi:hypothetical protein
MNVDETLTTENVVANDMMAVDAANGMDANMSADTNGLNAMEANDLVSNDADTNVANGM